MTRSGLPHSDIHGSKPACGYPWLFVARYVLHRPLAPRHPPYALYILTLYTVVEKRRIASLLREPAVLNVLLVRLRRQNPSRLALLAFEQPTEVCLT